MVRRLFESLSSNGRSLDTLPVNGSKAMAEIKAVEAKLSQEKAHRARFQPDYEAVYQERSALIAKKDKLTKGVSALQQQLNRLQQELSQTNGELTNLEPQYQLLHDQLEALDQQIADLTRKHELLLQTQTHETNFFNKLTGTPSLETIINLGLHALVLLKSGEGSKQQFEDRNLEKESAVVEEALTEQATKLITIYREMNPNISDEDVVNRLRYVTSLASVFLCQGIRTDQGMSLFDVHFLLEPLNKVGESDFLYVAEEDKANPDKAKFIFSDHAKESKVEGLAIHLLTYAVEEAIFSNDLNYIKSTSRNRLDRDIEFWQYSYLDIISNPLTPDGLVVNFPNDPQFVQVVEGLIPSEYHQQSIKKYKVIDPKSNTEVEAFAVRVSDDIKGPIREALMKIKKIRQEYPATDVAVVTPRAKNNGNQPQTP